MFHLILIVIPPSLVLFVKNREDGGFYLMGKIFAMSLEPT